MRYRFSALEHGFFFADRQIFTLPEAVASLERGVFVSVCPGVLCIFKLCIMRPGGELGRDVEIQ